MFWTQKRAFFVCAGFGLTSVGLTYYKIYKESNIYRDSKFFKDALSILESHPAARLLGLPLTAKYVDLVPSESDEPSPVAEFSAHIFGTKTSGMMYFWAERKKENDAIKIDITRIELQLADDKSKRVLIKK